MKFVLYASVLMLNIAAVTAANESLRVRPFQWAQPLLSEELENCYQVDKKLFRCGQPDQKAFDLLKAGGINEVLNLRQYHSDERYQTDGVTLHRLKWATGKVTEQDIIDALSIINQAKGSLMVHCWHGADRTGTVIAAYRIVFQDWSKQQAIDEMINGGYGYHAIYDNLIELLHEMDTEKVKAALAINSH